MSSLLKATAEYSEHVLVQRIIENVIRHKREMNLSTEHEERELSGHKYTGPTFVAAMRLVGKKFLEMYEEHPGLGTVDVDVAVQVPMRPATLKLATSNVDVASVRSIFCSEVVDEDDFCQEPELRGVILLDNIGTVVGEGRVTPDGGIDWIDASSLAEPDVALNIAEVKRLRQEAQLESTWDNFCSAKSLRERASRLERMIQIRHGMDRLAA